MNPTKDYIVHEGRIGVPDPVFPFPKGGRPHYDEPISRAALYDKNFKDALLHTAWFADEEQAIALRLIQKQRVDSGLIMSKLNPPDGLYTVPDMPEWEKVNQTITFGGDWLSEGVYNPEYPNDSEHRTIVRFVKEKEPKQ